jgi:hypothetical protein
MAKVLNHDVGNAENHHPEMVVLPFNHHKFISYSLSQLGRMLTF